MSDDVVFCNRALDDDADPVVAGILEFFGPGGMSRWHQRTVKAVAAVVQKGPLTEEMFDELHRRELIATKKEIVALREMAEAGATKPNSDDLVATDGAVN